LSGRVCQATSSAVPVDPINRSAMPARSNTLLTRGRTLIA
jgi:hypothetical protein